MRNSFNLLLIALACFDNVYLIGGILEAFRKHFDLVNFLLMWMIILSFAQIYKSILIHGLFNSNCKGWRVICSYFWGWKLFFDHCCMQQVWIDFVKTIFLLICLNFNRETKFVAKQCRYNAYLAELYNLKMRRTKIEETLGRRVDVNRIKMQCTFRTNKHLF